MRADALIALVDANLRWWAPRPTEPPAQWAANNIILAASEEAGRGPLRWRGREFAIDVVNDFARTDINDIVLCFGSQIGKTVILMCGLAWIVANDPRGIIWCSATRNLARSFSRKRWMGLVEDSPALEKFIPRGGQKRHDWAKSEQTLNGCDINFVGAGSKKELSSRPKSVAIMDETDKFSKELQGEAGAVNLIEQRVKNATRPLRVKVSTPSLTDGPIWMEYGKGNCMRYLVPCPHCANGVFLAWSKGQTVIPVTGKEAWAEWDKEAKRKSGWDYDRVRASARWICPHCGGHIQDHHKTAMIRGGKWEATRPDAARTFVSRHLPSLYGCSPATSLPAMAHKFLEMSASLEGLQGFINGELAEPWESQSDSRSRTETILLGDSVAPLAEQTVAILSVDVQRTSPGFYWVVREFDAGGSGHSRRIGVGTCEEWEQLDDIQRRYAVENHRVVIDSGDGVRTEEVYRECCRRGKLTPQGPSKLPLMVGWRPAKGAPGDARWKDKAGNVRMWGTVQAALAHTNFELRLFQFAGPAWKDVLAALRAGPEHAAGIRWEVLPDAEHDAEYWRHLDAKVKRVFHHARTGRDKHEWVKLSKGRPDHWDDCEVQCAAFAASLRLLPWASKRTAQPEPAT